MAKIFRNYNTLTEYEADTNKPVNTVCFIKDAKVIYVDGIRYSYKQLDYLPPAISEAEALEYMGKIIKNAQEVGLIYVKPGKPVPTIYWAGSDDIIISGTYYTPEPDKINIDGVEYYKIKLDKDLNNDTNIGGMFGNCSSLKTIRMVGCSQTTIDKIKAQLSTDGITGCTIVTE